MSEIPYISVVSAALFKEGKVLIAKRADLLTRYPSLWEFPGGKVDPGDISADDPNNIFGTIGRTLVREMKEELDLDLEGKNWFCVLQADHVQFTSEKHISPIRCDFYLLKVNLDPEHIPHKDIRVHSQLDWVDRDQLYTLTMEHEAPLNHMFRTYANRLITDDEVWK